MFRNIISSVQQRFVRNGPSSQARHLAEQTTKKLVKGAVLKDSKGRISKPIVWIDCEMTGLDHHNDHIIEICCVITDGNLNIVDKEDNNCYESVIHCDKSIMDKMGEWCIEHHGESGLTEKVLKSKKTKEQVEDELLEYIKKYIPDENVGILAGNSIHMDRLFMLKEFPKVINHLFYRLIDVSTIMEVGRRFNPEIVNVFPKKETAHTAKKDILESIAQLEWYNEHYLKSPEETKDFVALRREEMKKQESQDILNSLEKKRPAEESEEETDSKKRKTESEN
ncbi:similar to Saccharomyces cerevisiae YLR059C REX2 3'-5' RNA exonuclease [Maudiozyma saulgeensis]|uniref:Similar to Saccharomyces cerevisiae YLR059C REX2 3'-5' RNA exonuclease n=1 Tax=Maudiozyma saulgeensis TaxID=1789683 RepID=A0A1X7R2Y6_9SACH|nr:similar to Saccharomyces cerevisiae YLR059C REX2 3'-5' RNA exonuclease [Kazachstania saulgeensis]